MYWFETDGGTALHTGDCRMTSDSINRCLHTVLEQRKPLDRLYLDTTFCDPKFKSFPSRVY